MLASEKCYGGGKSRPTSNQGTGFHLPLELDNVSVEMIFDLRPECNERRKTWDSLWVQPSRWKEQQEKGC